MEDEGRIDGAPRLGGGAYSQHGPLLSRSHRVGRAKRSIEGLAASAGFTFMLAAEESLSRYLSVNVAVLNVSLIEKHSLWSRVEPRHEIWQISKNSPYIFIEK